ncbi:MAG: DASS family sodium-coupled anion symporter, partial [Bacteroidota bacterium]
SIITLVAVLEIHMWISNTATSVMMLPIGLAIIKQMQDNPLTQANEHTVFGKALMLAIAYSASIGGMATLIGTPPNLVLAGVVKDLYGIELSFLKWMAIGLPISTILLTICWLFLTKVAFRFPKAEFPGGKAEIQRLRHSLGPISSEEKWVLLIFVLTALAWISRKYLLQPIIPAIDDTLIAMMAGISLFLISTKNAEGSLLKWEDAKRIPWGIILLYGGGMALAEGFKSTGLAQWIGEQMTLLSGISLLVLVLILVTAVNFLTEVTSNLATTAMLLPILAPMALSLHIHPYLLLVAATLAASCAFMLPVATPPNAVVFGSGYLRIPDMVRAGVLLNLLSIPLITLVAYFLLPGIWEFAPDQFPTDWQSRP